MANQVDPARKAKNTFWLFGSISWGLAFLSGNAGSDISGWFVLGGIGCYVIAWNIKARVGSGAVYKKAADFEVRKKGF